MEERRKVSQILCAAQGDIDDETGDSVELHAQVKTIEAQRWYFRKRPDVPLGEILRRTGKRNLRS